MADKSNSGRFVDGGRFEFTWPREAQPIAVGNLIRKADLCGDGWELLVSLSARDPEAQEVALRRLIDLAHNWEPYRGE